MDPLLVEFKLKNKTASLAELNVKKFSNLLRDDVSM